MLYVTRYLIWRIVAEIGRIIIVMNRRMVVIAVMTWTPVMAFVKVTMRCDHMS